MTTIRYGLVGAGYFGREFARILNGIDGATVTHVQTRSGNTGDIENVTAVTSVDDLVDNVDAIIVASPNNAHLEPVLAAAAKGVHVFCEKPVALTYDECDRMVSACDEAGVTFMAGHVMHFMPGVEEVIDLVEAGEIGEPIVARTVRVGWEDGTAAPGWKKQRATSGGHHFHHIHELDLVQRLIGPADSATMIAGLAPQAGERVGDEDVIALATMTFPGDRYAVAQWGSVFRRAEHEITVQGTKGSVRFDMQNVTITVETEEGRREISFHGSPELDADRREENSSSAAGSGVRYGSADRRPPAWLRDAMTRELSYFHGLVSGTRTVEPRWAMLTDGSAARASIATAYALTRAAEERRTIEVAEITG